MKLEYNYTKTDTQIINVNILYLQATGAKIKAETTSNQLICLTDFFATLADITAKPVPDDGAEDSYSFLPALYGKPIVNERKGIIHQSIHGHFAYRHGKWKLLLAKGCSFAFLMKLKLDK